MRPLVAAVVHGEFAVLVEVEVVAPEVRHRVAVGAVEHDAGVGAGDHVVDAERAFVRPRLHLRERLDVAVRHRRGARRVVRVLTQLPRGEKPPAAGREPSVKTESPGRMKIEEN